MARSAMRQLADRMGARTKRSKDRDDEDEAPARKSKKAAKFEGFEVHFTLEKETPGAYRFKEVDEDGDVPEDKVIGTLYLRKSAFDGGKPPKRITVNIE